MFVAALPNSDRTAKTTEKGKLLKPRTIAPKKKNVVSLATLNLFVIRKIYFNIKIDSNVILIITTNNLMIR